MASRPPTPWEALFMILAPFVGVACGIFFYHKFIVPVVFPWLLGLLT